MNAMLEALQALGETELPPVSETKPRARRARKAPKLGNRIANGIARLNQAVSMDRAAMAAVQTTAPAAPETSSEAGLSRTFITAGKATFTISKLATGERLTFRISKPDNFRGEYFGSVIKGSDNENDYRYIGMVSDRDLSLRFTKGSKFLADTKEAAALKYSLEVVAGLRKLNPAYELRHAGRCGRCARLLTVPESIDSGIGPECAAQMGIAA